ncbi:complex proteins associated with Set1p component shg1-domain-containing protein, partial [Microdochium bolleyi]
MASSLVVPPAPAEQSDATPVAGSAAALAPRQFKASDLPLTSATRSAIESLAHSFKKKGGYDAIRKEVWEKFEASDYEAQIKKSILEVAEREVELNASQYLTLNQRKAAALIDGKLVYEGIYQNAETVIGQLIDDKVIEARIRQLRAAEIGEEAAEEERLRGSKTDEEYAAESTARL